MRRELRNWACILETKSKSEFTRSLVIGQDCFKSRASLLRHFDDQTSFEFLSASSRNGTLVVIVWTASPRPSQIRHHKSVPNTSNSRWELQKPASLFNDLPICLQFIQKWATINGRIWMMKSRKLLVGAYSSRTLQFDRAIRPFKLLTKPGTLLDPRASSCQWNC